MKQNKLSAKDVLLSAGIFILALAAGFLARYALHTETLIPAIFILAVFLISLYTQGWLPGVAAALAGTLAVNFIFTFPYYNFDFTVREVVLMGRAPHKKTLERDNAKDYQIVDEALKTVQMEAFADRTFSTLSGGEQQRVILARALAQQTSALILDEPTNHLDITHQIMLMELVKKLNVTVISAIHDLNIAAAYCDKIYVLKDGVLEGYGTPEEVLTPELIRRIYKVEAEIVYDSRGKMHILFL